MVIVLDEPLEPQPAISAALPSAAIPRHMRERRVEKALE
jgi:hypothetical protein